MRVRIGIKRVKGLKRVEGVKKVDQRALKQSIGKAAIRTSIRHKKNKVYGFFKQERE